MTIRNYKEMVHFQIVTENNGQVDEGIECESTQQHEGFESHQDDEINLVELLNPQTIRKNCNSTQKTN